MFELLLPYTESASTFFLKPQVIIVHTNNAAEEPYINVVGNYIYYVGVYDSGNNYGIYRVKTDGTGKTKLIGNYGYNSFIVQDNYLYYIKETTNSNYDEVSSLCRYNLSTKKTVSTLYTTTSRYIGDMSLSGDYIYISAIGDETSIIYKINKKLSLEIGRASCRERV